MRQNKTVRRRYSVRKRFRILPRPSAGLSSITSSCRACLGFLRTRKIKSLLTSRTRPEYPYMVSSSLITSFFKESLSDMSVLTAHAKKKIASLTSLFPAATSHCKDSRTNGKANESNKMGRLLSPISHRNPRVGSTRNAKMASTSDPNVNQRLNIVMIHILSRGKNSRYSEYAAGPPPRKIPQQNLKMSMQIISGEKAEATPKMPVPCKKQQQ